MVVVGKHFTFFFCGFVAKIQFVARLPTLTKLSPPVTKVTGRSSECRVSGSANADGLSERRAQLSSRAEGLKDGGKGQGRIRGGVRRRWAKPVFF